MKHGLQIFASAMFFAVIVFMVWYTICGMQGAEEGPEGTLVFHEDGSWWSFERYGLYKDIPEHRGA